MHRDRIAALIAVAALSGCAPAGMYYPWFSSTPLPIPRSEQAGPARQASTVPYGSSLTPEEEARDDAQYPDCVPIHRPDDPRDAAYYELRNQCIAARRAQEARFQPQPAPPAYDAAAPQDYPAAE